MSVLLPYRPAHLHPIRWIEEFLIALALDPDTTPFYHDYMTVRWAVRVTPGVSPRTLQRAFDKLVARHEPLRLRYVETRDGWMSEVLNAHPTGLIIEDLGPASPAEQLQIATERVRRPLTALSEALFELRLLRFGATGDVIVLRANHAIIDAYSVAVLIEELLKFTLNWPIGPAPMPHGDYVTHQLEKTRQNRTEKARFWDAMLSPVTRDLNIGRTARGLGIMDAGAVQAPLSCDGFLQAGDCDNLFALCQAKKASPFAVLAAAYGQTLCAKAQCDNVLINSIFSRTDAALSTYVGPSIEVAPLRYDHAPDALCRGIADVAQKLSVIPQHLPTDLLAEDSPLILGLEDRNVSFDRFWVTSALPTGRMKVSPFRQMIEKAMQGPFSLGPFALEQITIPSLAPTDAEMELAITPTDTGCTATLYANPAGYEQTEVEEIAEGIRDNLAHAAAGLR